MHGLIFFYHSTIANKISDRKFQNLTNYYQLILAYVHDFFTSSYLPPSHLQRPGHIKVKIKNLSVVVFKLK